MNITKFDLGAHVVEAHHSKEMVKWLKWMERNTDFLLISWEDAYKYLKRNVREMRREVMTAEQNGMHKAFLQIGKNELERMVHLREEAAEYRMMELKEMNLSW